MAQISPIDVSTKDGKCLLMDFLHWKKTGFSPLKKVGSIDHYRSRSIYAQVTKATFCSQAKIAMIDGLSSLLKERQLHSFLLIIGCFFRDVLPTQLKFVSHLSLSSQEVISVMEESSMFLSNIMSVSWNP
jgi:hypothetical protein